VSPHRTLAVLAAVVALGGAACSHAIGDDCKTSADCDPSGTRACDLSQPGGYCTIAGCNETSCPSGSTCIRYFPQMYLSKACDPTCEDLACDAGVAEDGGVADGDAAVNPAADGAVDDGGLVIEDDCEPDEVCVEVSNQPHVGLCSKQTYEQRQCAKSCSSNNDCRAGYWCRPSGTDGNLVLATNPLAKTAFCAPYIPGVSTPQ
jgi:hypothetical protein